MGALVQISVEVNAEAAEAVCELFNRLQDASAPGRGAVGHAVIEGRDFPETADTDPELIDITQARSITVKTCVPAGPQAQALQARIAQGLWWLSRIYPAIPEPRIAILEDKDWQEAWKERYSAFRVGQRFVIQPVWEEPAHRPADVVLRLNPGMAFGTGLHPSTQLCLELLESCAASGQRLLDVGTGSGILAIAALKLGIAYALGTDTDAQALQVARENARHNGLREGAGQRLVFRQGSLADAGPFDVAVVNILPHVIAQLLGEEGLLDRITPGGTVILSGIIEERRQEVEAALHAAGGRLRERRRKGDWVALVGSQSDVSS